LELEKEIFKSVATNWVNLEALKVAECPFRVIHGHFSNIEICGIFVFCHNNQKYDL
jgi:hypothetical protein